MSDRRDATAVYVTIKGERHHLWRDEAEAAMRELGTALGESTNVVDHTLLADVERVLVDLGACAEAECTTSPCARVLARVRAAMAGSNDASRPPRESNLAFEPGWERIGVYCSAGRRSLWLRAPKADTEDDPLYTPPYFELCAGREGDDAYVRLDRSVPVYEQLLAVLSVAPVAGRSDATSVAPPMCRHYEEDDFGAAIVGSVCGCRATHYSCCHAGPAPNACEDHKCRCKQPAGRFDASPSKLDADDAHYVVQKLLFAMHIYPGYKVEARGPTGCMLDAIRCLEPETHAKVVAGADLADLLDDEERDPVDGSLVPARRSHDPGASRSKATPDPVGAEVDCAYCRAVAAFGGAECPRHPEVSATPPQDPRDLVVDAARELLSWDWLHLLKDYGKECGDVVEVVHKLDDALGALQRRERVIPNSSGGTSRDGSVDAPCRDTVSTSPMSATTPGRGPEEPGTFSVGDRVWFAGFDDNHDGNVARIDGGAIYVKWDRERTELGPYRPDQLRRRESPNACVPAKEEP